MGGLHNSITNAFGVQKVFREKGNYKNSDSTLLIRKTKDSQIPARYQLCRHCSKAGYPWLESYHLSRDGKPYVLYEGEYYVMTDLIGHPEADFNNEAEFLQTVTALASFHKVARGIEIGEKIPPLTEEMRIQGAKIDGIRKRIRKHNKLSDFDLMFVKNYSDYRDRIKRACQLLENTGYFKREANAFKQGHICHGALKENCLRVYGHDIYICKFESAYRGYQLRDLAELIRRREKKLIGKAEEFEEAAGDETEKGIKLIKNGINLSRICETYSQVLPLDPEEEVILGAMLLYPAAFVKISLEYYQKKRSWTPVSMANKMQEILTNIT